MASENFFENNWKNYKLEFEQEMIKEFSINNI